MTRPRWIWLVPLFGMIALFPVLFLGKTVTPVLNWVGVVPLGAYHAPEDTKDSPKLNQYFNRDPVGIISLIPNEAYSLIAGGRGEVPFWNPYQGLGQLLVGEMQMGFFYPVGWLRTLIPTSYYEFYSLLHWFLAAFFVYALASTLGLPAPYAAFSGAAVFSVGFIQEFAALASLIAILPWTPLLWLGIERVIQNPRCRFKWLPIVWGTFALLTAGHMPPTVYGAVAVAIYFTARLVGASGSRREVLKLLPYFFVGILLAAPQWLLFLHNAILNGGQFRGADPFFFRGWQFPAMIFPYLYGGFLTGSPFETSNPQFVWSDLYWTLGWLPASVSFLAFYGIAASRKSSMIALGAVVLVMVGWAFGLPPFSLISQLPFLGRLRPSYVMYAPYFALCIFSGFGLQKLAEGGKPQLRASLVVWAGVTLATLAVSWKLYRLVGGVDFKIHQDMWDAGIRCGVIWAIAIPIGFYLVRRALPRDSEALILVAVGATLFAAISYFPRGVDASVVRSGRLEALYNFLALVVLVLFSRRWNLSRNLAWLALAILGLVLSRDIFVVRPGIPNRADVLKPAPYVAFLKEHTGPARVLGTAGFFSGNVGTFFEIASINSQSALVPQPATHFVETYLNQSEYANVYLGTTMGRLSGEKATPAYQFNANRPVWNYLGVKYIVAPLAPARSAFSGTADLRSVYRDEAGGAEVWENHAAKSRLYFSPRYEPVASWESGQAGFAKQPADRLRATAFGEAKQPCPSNGGEGVDLAELTVNGNHAAATVRTATGGTLVLTDLYNPGWSAIVDGKPAEVFRVNGVFRGLCLPSAGTHSVTWAYVPPLWRLSLILAAFGIVGVIVLLCGPQGIDSYPSLSYRRGSRKG